jgi:pyridinium-3,5-biscarboxylic acid mononucleotide synthase
MCKSQLKGAAAIKDHKITELLEQVRRGEVSVAQALERLRGLPYEDLGFAKVDHHRLLHKGFPEVIFCPGKTVEQIVEITRRLAVSGAVVLATRAEPAVFAAVQQQFPAAEYHEAARAVVIRGDSAAEPYGNVGVVSAGTADLPVAEEAALTAELMGSRVFRLYDVGVAGIHRLLDNRDRIEQARVLVVVAGMEGALASVVGGLAACPVIAVPTSIGYGAHFGGLAPLLTMLNSCATGVAVVNIDNGFGAGYIAALINRVGEPGGGPA